MSELVETRRGLRAASRLRVGVAMAALMATVAHTGPSNAGEDESPTVWIELGGQLNRMGGGEEFYVPPFLAGENAVETLNVPALIDDQRRSRYSKGIEGSISFAPRNTDWILSASVRYSRTNRNAFVHQQTAVSYYNTKDPLAGFTVTKTRAGDTRVGRSETQTIVDFTAGKDVGIGAVGKSGSSTFSLGLRFAQFSSNESGSAYAVLPHISFPPPKYLPNVRENHYTAMANASRSFHGIGPSLNWSASSVVEGASSGSEISLDWGLNGAILFGRQKAQMHSATNGYYRALLFNPLPSVVTRAYATQKNVARAKSAVVPNVGGFVGLSLRFPNARVKLGYRADVFFGAIDGGIGTRKTYDRSFYGPFATISIGLGG